MPTAVGGWKKVREKNKTPLCQFLSRTSTPVTPETGRRDAVWWCSAWRSADASIAKQSRCSASQLALAPGIGSRGRGAAAIAALTRRWTALAALAALRAHAQSLLELPIRPCDASDGAELPLGELLAEPP